MYTIITNMSSSSVCAFLNDFIDSLVSGFVMANIFNPQQFYLSRPYMVLNIVKSEVKRNTWNTIVTLCNIKGHLYN